ncbi:peptidoglycan-binding domain-containing protein [Pseudogemmobacter bohemicus]|uniref:peptidoglycan-binding domain-containing protein n=1 Tax=Pseudogemmobacter bohemicus TaxID=2250708 RepID=UPI001E3F7453|nr:peptidoglycan-binding domain-containing protein [Pseudogemmobacter bohemicus]
MLIPAFLILAACDDGSVPTGPTRADFSAEIVDLKGKPGPPKGPEGACWQSDIRPAVIETVTEQVLVSPETRDEAGTLLSPARFASEAQQRIVSDRSTVWFRIPCPDVMTPEFIATLQRALKARGLYLLPLTGVMDAPTRTALRGWQQSRGLDSDHLSLAAARELGLVIGNF